METKYKTHHILEVVFIVLLISSCGRELSSSTYAVEIRSQSVSSSLKPAFLDTKPDLILTGPTESYTQYGNYARFGDVNGDGYEDLLVAGAWHYNKKQGRLYLYYGGRNMDDKPDKIFTGENLGDGFGAEAYLADVNGDSYADVVTGAAEYNNQQGRVYIFYGGPDMDETADIVIDGEAGTHGFFGHTITAGDVNNDGYKDVIASAVFYNNNKGRVYLFFGGNPMDTTADVIFDGESEKDHYFGRDINNPKMVGDVNGDGFGDLLISSRYWNYWGGANGQGRARLYYGGPGTSMDAIPDKVFTGENRKDDFGCSGCIFDVDNDGFDDVIIGARGYNDPQGRVYLYWGGVDMDTVPDKVFNGEPGVSGWFGGGLDAGDVNNDDYGDIVVAAPFYSQNPWSGRAYLFYGGTKESINTTCDKVFTLPTEKKNGSQHVALGDIDNDKCLELAIGGPEYNNSQGRVWLYDNKPSGSTDEPPRSLPEAAATGEVNEVEALISKGVDVNAREWGSLKTALHYGAEKGHKKVVEILLAKGTNTDARDALSTTPLNHAVEKGHKEIAGLLIDNGADVNAKRGYPAGDTPLHSAVRAGHKDVIELLIAKGADVNAKNNNGVTTLHVAASGGHKEVVELLLSKGANVNAADRNGVASLHTTAKLGNTDMAALLIDKGADVNTKDKWIWTPLHYACWKNHKDTVELLLARGADLNAKEEEGKTPLGLAKEEGHTEIVELLRKHGAKE